ncbi:MAG: MurR/RpiR family transcriptional regulator [Leucobacter sp.]
MTRTDSPSSRLWRGDGQPLLEQIRLASASFSESEKRVARAVQADPRAMMTSSVTEFAHISGTSVGSVVRFCQRFGLQGFQEFKLLLSRETPPDSPDSADDDDPLTSTVRGTLRESAGALEAAADHIDLSGVTAIVDALASARRIRFAAVGTSAPLASDAAYRFTALGLDATFAPDFIAQHVAVQGLDERDVCFVISHTGSTKATLEVARTAADSGAKVIAITSFLTSPLTEIAHALIVAGSSETRYRVEAMTSRIVHLSLLDAIYNVLTIRAVGATARRDEAEKLVNSHRI